MEEWQHSDQPFLAGLGGGEPHGELRRVRGEARMAEHRSPGLAGGAGGVENRRSVAGRIDAVARPSGPLPWSRSQRNSSSSSAR